MALRHPGFFNMTGTPHVHEATSAEKRPTESSQVTAGQHPPSAVSRLYARLRKLFALPRQALADVTGAAGRQREQACTASSGVLPLPTQGTGPADHVDKSHLPGQLLAVKGQELP